MPIGKISNLLGGAAVVGLILLLAADHRALVQEQEASEKLRQQLEQSAEARVEEPHSAKVLAEAASEPARAAESAELLRLRGEVALLRQQIKQAPPVNVAGPASRPSVAAANPGVTSGQPSVEAKMRAEGRSWVQTHSAITVGSVVQDKIIGRPGMPAEAGTLGRVISVFIGDDAGGTQTAVVDFGNYTRTYNLSELAAVSDTPAPDSPEGTLRAQGTQWSRAEGTVAAGDWVEDVLVGRHDQPDGRGALGKVVSVSTEDGKPPGAMVDFGRGYTVGLNLSEIAKVNLVPAR